MAQVKGIYTFKDTITPIAFGSETVNFVSNALGTERNYVRIQGSTDLGSSTALVYAYRELSSDNYPEETVYLYQSIMDLPTGWQNETAKIIDFGETEQTVSDEFYTWLMENTIAKKTVKGIWTLKDTLTPATFESQDVNFGFYDTDHSKYRTGFSIAMNGAYNLNYYYYRPTSWDSEMLDVWSAGAYTYPNPYTPTKGWSSIEAKTIDFGETPQEVSDEFYSWLEENVVLVVDYPQITIMENGTTTLATAGKYCDRNIVVDVDVSDADAILDGSFSGAYESNKVTKLRAYAFYNCADLASVSLPNCTELIGASHFYGCSNLESVNLPNCTLIGGNNTFYYATNLRTIDLHNVTTIKDASRLCYHCDALEGFNAPNLTSSTNTLRMFDTCSSLKRVCFPKLSGTTISVSTFQMCKDLTTLVLGGSQLNSLDNVNAFIGSGIAKGTGYIYVPDDLVDAYKTATNWAVYADQIKPISEYKTLITFTINNQPYQAEEGMTWGEWVVSEYNTDGYYARESDNRVLSSDNRYVWTLKNTVILANLVIESDASYKTTGWEPEEE